MEKTNSNQSSRPWKTAAIGFGVLMVLGTCWGLVEFQRAQNLAESLEKERQHSASLQVSLVDANQRLNDAATQLKANEARLTEAVKPNLPVVINFRPAILGNGLVAVFRNTSSSQLEVAAAFSSEATGMRRGANLVIPGNGVTEVGYAQGWAFAAGQRIHLTNSEFRPAEYQVPGI
jgi:hypothetical protein